MNNIVGTDFLGFPHVNWLHLTGKVDKSAKFSSGFNMPNVIEIG